MTCNIVLENFQGTYYPGNTISGHVVCTFPSGTNIGGVRVKLRGNEHTSWVQGEFYYDLFYGKTRFRNVHYSGDDEFLAVDLTLIGESTLSSGRYEYPFTFTLPRNLPTNFEGTHGYIKYFIKATVYLPLTFDYEDETFFNVHSPIDFNEIISELPMEPTIYRDERTVCSFCCTSGPITVDVHLQKQAFVLGETAKIKIIATNLSNVNIDEMNVKIAMFIEFMTTNPRVRSKYDTELVVSDSDTGVGAHGQRTYDFDLKIPSATVLYNFKRCALFKQYFVLKIGAVIAGCNNTNMEIETNVVLGHIPVASGQGSQPSQQISNPTSANTSEPFSLPPPDSEPPPYSASDEAPPYPTGPSAFPSPTLGQIGSRLAPEPEQKPLLPSIGMPPVPVHGVSYAPGPGANAPPAESIPSAPTKVDMAEGGDLL